MKIISIILISLFIFSCASSTQEGAVGANRKQFLMVSSAEIEAESAKGYQQVIQDAQSKKILNTNVHTLNRVRTIGQKLIPYTSVFRADSLKWNWEINVISSKELNAWCMPGGKIVFYTGIIDQLQMTDGEIAAVMGHEIAHALREHGRERYSQEIAKQMGASLLAASGLVDAKYVQLGLVASTFLSLKHGRGQESEADTIGLELMARAGYSPEEAISLWKKMAAATGGAKSPEFLSTHPSDSTRIQQIAELLPRVKPLYEAAKK